MAKVTCAKEMRREKSQPRSRSTSRMIHFCINCHSSRQEEKNEPMMSRSQWRRLVNEQSSRGRSSASFGDKRIRTQDVGAFRCPKKRTQRFFSKMEESPHKEDLVLRLNRSLMAIGGAWVRLLGKAGEEDNWWEFYRSEDLSE